MLKFFTTFLFSFFLFLNTANADPGTAKDRVEFASARIMELLLQDDFQNIDTRPQVIKELEVEIMKFFDFEEFSVRTIGPRWKQFNADQKVAFQTAFTNLLRSSYIDTLDSYNGQRLVYVGEIASANNERVEVHTLFQGEASNYPVSFRMLVKNGEWVVYDVIIEGISLIKNYREQFRDILANSSPDELIKRIQEKAVTKAKKMEAN